MGGRVRAVTDSAYVRLGQICGVYGVRGWVRVFSDTEPRDNITAYATWRLTRDTEIRDYRLESAERRGGAIVAKLAGVDDPETASALVGADIGVPRSELPDCGRDQYYWADLEGLTVRNARGEELGVVDHLIETGAHDVMVLAGPQPKMIPFVIGVSVIDVDLDGGIISVDWESEYFGG
jgi:16S rRNA processing protein RimM